MSDKDWTTAPMPEVIREQHRLLVEMEEIGAMYRKLAEAELMPRREQLARLRDVTKARQHVIRPQPLPSTVTWMDN